MKITNLGADYDIRDRKLVEKLTTQVIERLERVQADFLPTLPGMEDLDFGSDPTPVNIFRMLFDLYFGTELGQLPARSYYASSPAPFRFIEITDRLP